MIVTEMKELTRSRIKVVLDGEFAFVLYKGELRRYHILVGEALGKKEYEEIFHEVLPKRAKMRAMNLLLKKDYTTAQLRRKLLQGGYPNDIVEEALTYVQSFRYTDDQRYAMNYILCHEKDKSRIRIEHDLQLKGIDDEIIEKAFLQWEQEGGEQDEDEMIQKLLAKRHYDALCATPADQKREYAYLMRKGFSADRIAEVIFSHDNFI